MHPRVLEVTRRIQARSAATRQRYLEMVRAAASKRPHRGTLPCGNLAHGVAACGESDKQTLRLMNQANVAIVSAYNDMLSAHQPFERFPGLIKQALHEIGSVGQFAGGVPAMCDGVTQGEPGMELSLASRDVIAMSTAIALSHNMFDAALCLGVCDKIVPGLLIGSLRFGHLPTVFVPAGPMPTGISNKEKAAVRQLFAEGKATREELLASEMASYHAPGTCTFYGTANTNQLLVEVMGLHCPVPPSSARTPRCATRLTREAPRQSQPADPENGNYVPMAEIVDEKAIVNSVVALLATGGSTNHTPAPAGDRPGGGHPVDLAGHVRAVPCGADPGAHLSERPGRHQPLPGGRRHVLPDPPTARRRAASRGRTDRRRPRPAPLHPRAVPRGWPAGLARRGRNGVSTKPSCVRWTSRSPPKALAPDGGQPRSRRDEGLGGGSGTPGGRGAGTDLPRPGQPGRSLQGRRAGARPGRRGAFQGPRANGMPELHKLTPFLEVLQDRGFKVALVTDGRMSGRRARCPRPSM